MNNFFTRIITLLFLLHISFFAVAQGDLLIAPKRIVFDGSKRVEEINLANIGKDTATYTISKRYCNLYHFVYAISYGRKRKI